VASLLITDLDFLIQIKATKRGCSSV